MTRILFEAIYHRSNTFKPATGHQILLRKLAITPAEPILGDRYQVRAHVAQFRLPGRQCRLVHPASANMASVDLNECCVLYRGVGGSAFPL
jgi:hypothetical protein